MREERAAHTATLLSDGKVLVTGGGTAGGGQFPAEFGEGSTGAEVYDPATGQFTSTGSMAVGRVAHTATLLANGKVLIVGGWVSSDPTATAELYDPAAKTFIATGSMASARAGHTATLLHDGRVLIAGGVDNPGSLPIGSNTTEIYDPATGSFVSAGSMAVARRLHTATLLPDQKVLVIGGGSRLAEIYDPATNSFSPVGLTIQERSGHSATLLQNGHVVVIGGFASIGGFTPQPTAELY
jgi:N-acetylneuraminic acid mutarotase